MSKEMTFTVFCLENDEVHRSLSGREVSALFERYGVFDYIREFYDVLLFVSTLILRWFSLHQ